MEKESTAEGIRIGQADFGLGVFATRIFAEEETVGQVHGRMIYDPDHQSDYCIGLSEHHSLEPAAPFRFLNHSCEPNCLLTQVDVEDDDGQFVDAEIWVETLRKIEPGEQLTIDYAWPADGAIPCGCGSPSCRGWIVDELEARELAPKRSLPSDEPSNAA